ncbi:protein javelin isoform X2 [Leptopilina boulardi]|uniref:protein javelin isoform X2 n=1 Tax=Leptopilina boulardi TaxID=63433 RepID=UPI0021F66A93|nr:protein javelin isoform X2 [Leptopilina boulardi]
MFSVQVVYCQVSMKFTNDEEKSSEGSQCESHGSQSSTQERRKLLKRTRSLAVISEDESRYTREIPHFRINEPNFNLTRRPQLIPRPKLIDRNSLKYRLSKSQQQLFDSYDKFTDTKSNQSKSSCTLYSPPPLTLLPDPLPYVRGNKSESDRLNILDWPDSSRKYCSVQNLDTVSGLVEIVEDNWPLEENRSLDCIYTQVKRKRKEHRSLDSILFEDDDELQYFDVLNLLPLSNVCLGESAPKIPNRCKERDDFFDGILSISDKESTKDFFSTSGNNETDEEKSKNQEDEGNDSRKGFWIELVSPSKQERKDFWERLDDQEQKRQVRKEVEKFQSLEKQKDEIEKKEEKKVEIIQEEKYLEETKIEITETQEEVKDEKLDLKTELSIFEETLKSKEAEEVKIFQARNPFPRSSNVKELSKSLADKYKANVAIVTPCEEKFKVEEVEDVRSIWISDEEEEMSRRPQVLKIIDNDLTKRCNKNENPSELIETKSIESARNFFEKKSNEKEGFKNSSIEGRFERIVKETTNIFDKACNVMKGTLGFEARSESSDLGLGSEIESDRRRSIDENTNGKLEKLEEKKDESEKKKNYTNLTRSRSCVDSLECQDEPEFNHVRYKIVKSNLFGKNIFSTSKGDVTYEGLMDYLREYSFQELLLDNNVVIIEPVRAEVERKPSMNVKSKSLPTCRISGAMEKKREITDERKNFNEKSQTCPRQSLLRKHFFYHPIRINKELIDDELPNPDTVKNVTRMFEETFRAKKSLERDKNRSLSMKDLSVKEEEGVKNEDGEFYEKVRESRSRSSSRAKDLTRHFENLKKKTNSLASVVGKDEPECPRSESKTRILAQSFEARSGHTSPSDSNSSNKNRITRFNQHNRHHNWDAGSVSSGVSSDYPDTDPAPCTSSEDEEIDCQDEEIEDESGPGHYVSQDVLRKIRECGTSVTYYGGKVVNTYNGPIISPMNNKHLRRRNQLQDYVKFRLVKSNSCDSRLELTGKVVEEKVKVDKNSDLRQCTIAEMPSIELSLSMERQEMKKMMEEEEKEIKKKKIKESKKEPPVVIGSEPKKDEGKCLRADFKLGKLDESNSRFSALSKWQINENGWRKNTEFDKMEFEEFEILEDSLNGIDNES